MLLLLLAPLASAMLCGTYDAVARSGEQLRVCFELESLDSAFCVAGTSSSGSAFAAAVIALDRAIVVEYAALANVASLFGERGQTCVDHWRRARCAEAFPLSDTARVCTSTCARLVAAACDAQVFAISSCAVSNPSATCSDVSTLEPECIAEPAQAAPAPPPPVTSRPRVPMAPRPFVPRPASGTKVTLAVSLNLILWLLC